MTKFELPMLGDSADHQAKIVKWREMCLRLPPWRRQEFFDFIYNLLEASDYYEADVYKVAVFSYQFLQQNNLLDSGQKEKAFKQLYKLTSSNIVRKRYTFSNAVSITLREFYNDPKFPKTEVEKAYKYIVQNMSPIPQGFGANRCQKCWQKTLSDMLKVVGITIGKEQLQEIYNITNLNIFQNQLKDSYDEEIKEKMNKLYEIFFGNVKDIRVHDIQSTDKKVKYEDKKMQKQGVDKTITFTDGTQHLVEEKFREAKFWPNRLTDILLEYISIDNKDIPGWVYTSRSEYLVILYKNMELDKSEVYIFPFRPIREWVRNNEKRFMSFPDIVAHNVAWNTISKAVPLPVVLNEMLKGQPDKFKIRYTLS